MPANKKPASKIARKSPKKRKPAKPKPKIARIPPATTGRPPIYADPEVMEKNIQDYFNTCDNKDIPYTVPGLAVHLGFESRFRIQDYKNRPLFQHTIKSALSRIESQRVGNMVAGKGNVVGAIFDLKNNFGYVDKREVETTNTYLMLSDKQLEARLLDRLGQLQLPDPDVIEADYDQLEANDDCDHEPT